MDIEVNKEDPFTCFSNFVAISVNNTHFGPYCGYGSMYQYQDSDQDSVDCFEIKDSSNGGLLPAKDHFFGWRKFKVNKQCCLQIAIVHYIVQIEDNTPIEIVFLSEDNNEGRYGWRIDWKIENNES